MRDLLRIQYNRCSFNVSVARGWRFDIVRIGAFRDKAAKQFKFLVALLSIELWFGLYWGDNRAL